MSVYQIPKASECYSVEEKRGYAPMVENQWKDLAADSIKAVGTRIERLNREKAVNRAIELPAIEVILGIWLKKVYNQGRKDAAKTIANGVQEKIMSMFF